MNGDIYNRVQRDPDPDGVFRVTAGLVAIMGLERNVAWPADLVRGEHLAGAVDGIVDFCRDAPDP